MSLLEPSPPSSFSLALACLIWDGYSLSNIGHDRLNVWWTKPQLQWMLLLRNWNRQRLPQLKQRLLTNRCELIEARALAVALCASV